MENIITYDLTENFIKNLADSVEADFLKKEKDIGRLCFVFAGKRPALFLKKELSQRIKKAFFSPQFFSIDEFVEYILRKKDKFSRISDFEAAYIIYKLTADIAPQILTGRDGFSRFISWANEILSFIEHLDLEDIKPERLKNIQTKASIGYDIPASINSLLESIISIREAYHIALKQKQAYSRGFIYLLASRYVRETEFNEFERIFFCGFFYLHKTEETIIKTLYESQKAALFFQGNADEWSVLKKTSETIASSIRPMHEQKPGYNLCIQAGFDVHSEVCLAREILKKTVKSDNTVIVLPKSDNLIPLLSETAAYVSDFNISIGYPLKRSSLYSLFECIFKAQETKKQELYYAKDYLKALAHPLVKNLKLLSGPSVIRILVHKIEEVLLGIEKTSLSGSLFLKLSDIQNSRELFDAAAAVLKKMDITAGWDELKGAVARLHRLLFGTWENIGNFCEFAAALDSFIGTLLDTGLLASYPFNLKMAEKIFSIKDEFRNASFNKEIFPKDEIFRIFKNKIENEAVSFSGSPLKGLQILGLFETRSLSFENVIILDVNESALPNLRICEPLIPREVMINLGLDRIEKEEEIQRYHFKRLISSAKNVYLIYRQSPDAERSRFIEELIWERQKRENSLEAVVIPRAGFKVTAIPGKSEIKKDRKFLKLLNNYEYSPTCINTYLHCPLKFYFQYVLNLREKEDLLDEPEQADIGNFIHRVLYETFSRFIGRAPRINAEFKDEFFSALNIKFAEEFEKKMKADSFLIKQIIDFRMERFLENEKKRSVKAILCLEKKITGKIRLMEADFNFKAVVDRIDLLSGDCISVIDYKTGNADIMPETDFTAIESAGFSRQALKNTIKSLQLPIYIYLVENSPGYKGRKINAALYPIKYLALNKNDSGLNTLFRDTETFTQKDRIMDVYLKALGCLVREILNPEIPFEADDENRRQCEVCPFFYLCR